MLDVQKTRSIRHVALSGKALCWDNFRTAFMHRLVVITLNVILPQCSAVPPVEFFGAGGYSKFYFLPRRSAQRGLVERYPDPGASCCTHELTTPRRSKNPQHLHSIGSCATLCFPKFDLQERRYGQEGKTAHFLWSV